MAYKNIIYEVEKPVATITLNRPKSLNALTQPLWTELKDALLKAEADDDVRAVVLAGAGRSFCVGYDLTEDYDPPLKTAADWHASLSKDMAVTMTIWNLEKPVIASVRGHCLAAGFEVALACDLTIAAEGSSFGEPEVRFGSGPVTLLMPWIIGMKKTRELLYTGDSVSAEEAERLGIVNQVVPEDKLEEEARALAVKVALVPPEVMRLTKLPINRTFEIMGLHEALNTNVDQSSMLNTADVPELAEFEKITEEQGLKAALKWRENRYS
jgi:enoyl-CoA hydratase